MPVNSAGIGIDAYGRQQQLPQSAGQLGALISVEIGGSLTLEEPALAVRAALEGTGIAFAFESQVKDLLAEGRLIRVLEDWCLPYTGYHLYYSSRRHMPAALRAFVDFVRTT